MNTPGITHQYGPWSPIRFIPVPAFGADTPPAFWITTSRHCRGLHDWLCAEGQTQTFGPLVLPDTTAGDVWTCPNCHRTQPPSDAGFADGKDPVCLFCSDSATVQHTGDSRDTAAAVTAVAALHTATATLRQVDGAQGFIRTIDLLEGCGEDLRTLLDFTALAVKQEPYRSLHTVNRIAVRIARTITANARKLIPTTREPLPVTENDEG